MKDGVYVKSEDRYLQSPVAEGEPPAHFVESVCVSPDGETLTCVTKRAQLYCAPLSRLDENDDEPFVRPQQGRHSDTRTDDLCIVTYTKLFRTALQRKVFRQESSKIISNIIMFSRAEQ